MSVDAARFSPFVRFAAALALLGCSPVAAPSIPPTPLTSASSNRTASAAVPGEAVRGEAVPGKEAAPGKEEWFVVRMAGAPCGWIRETSRPGKGGAVDRSTEMQLRLRRGRDETGLRQEVHWSETAAGELVRFASTFTAGPAPQRLDGERRGANLVLYTHTAQGVKETVRPWPAGAESFSAVERRLEAKPPAAGSAFKVLKLDWAGPSVEFVEVEVRIVGREDQGPGKGLWKAEQTTRLPGGAPLSSMTLWLDDAGRIERALSPQLEQEIVRSTKDNALTPEAPPPDLFALSLVPLAPEGSGPALLRAEAVEYRATAAAWDEAKDGAALPFANSGFQQVEAVAPGVWKVVVRRPDLSAQAAPPAPPRDAKQTDAKPVDVAQPAAVPAKTGPEKAALEKAAPAEEEWVDWRHPAVQKLAQSVPAGKSAAETALRLTRTVHEHMRLKNFTQALAKASDAAATGEGDCTEHAFLLAALARAHGLPSRAAVGLVYVERPRPGFLYHMWTEIECDGKWLPFDGTTGGPTHAGYLHIASNDLARTSAVELFLPVQRLVGRLKLLLVSAK